MKTSVLIYSLSMILYMYIHTSQWHGDEVSNEALPSPLLPLGTQLHQFTSSLQIRHAAQFISRNAEKNHSLWLAGSSCFRSFLHFSSFATSSHKCQISDKPGVNIGHFLNELGWREGGREGGREGKDIVFHIKVRTRDP